MERNQPLGGAGRSLRLVVLLLVSVSVVRFLFAPRGGRARALDSTAIHVRFVDIARAAGISFQQDGTATEEKYYLETMGTGVGWIDYDQDGLMDLFFVQSAATDIYKPPRPLRSALYHNNGDGTLLTSRKRRASAPLVSTGRV